MNANANRLPPMIMIVDDEEDLTELGRALLEAWGYRALVSRSPEAAIALAEVSRPAAFILDIGMPGMDGYDLGAVLKFRHPGAMFIGYSAWPSNAEREKAAKFSFDHFAQKPAGFVDIEALLKPLQAPELGISTSLV